MVLNNLDFLPILIAAVIAYLPYGKIMNFFRNIKNKQSRPSTEENSKTDVLN